MKYCFVLFIFWTTWSFSQISFSQTKIDFGDLLLTSQRYVDILLSNTGTKKEYILTIKKPGDVVYLTQGQFIEPHGTTKIRLQVNPTKKGKFSYFVEIYTSDKDTPTYIELKGNLKELPYDNTAYLRECPDFNAKLPVTGQQQTFDVAVITIDKTTQTVLANSKVTLIQNGKPTASYLTNKQGFFAYQFQLGFTYFYALHDGYEPAEMGAYINLQRKTVVIEMVPNKIVNPPIEIAKPAVEEFVEVPVTVEEELEVTQNTPIQKVEVKALSELAPTNFDSAYFQPVNIVFVLDVSSSMKVGEKMELMKYALFELTKVLRPQDQISIITYSTTASVFMSAAAGNQKDLINQKVSEIKAYGLTAGGDGIKLGFKEAKKHFIANGVNEVIIITDGAFNRNSTDYQKTIAKYKKKGIYLSVVGIQNSDKDKTAMETVAQLGNGRYIPIMKLIDAQLNLKEEIRYISFKRNQ